MCRRLEPSFQPPETLVIWLNSDAKELHCLTPLKPHYCTRRIPLCYSLQQRCLCVRSCLFVCALFIAFCVSIIVPTCVCLRRDCMRLHFPKRGGGPLGVTTMYPVIEMQPGKCCLNLTLFSLHLKCSENKAAAEK